MLVYTYVDKNAKYIYVYVYTYIYTYMHMYIYVYVYVHACEPTCLIKCDITLSYASAKNNSYQQNRFLLRDAHQPREVDH